MFNPGGPGLPSGNFGPAAGPVRVACGASRLHINWYQFVSGDRPCTRLRCQAPYRQSSPAATGRPRPLLFHSFSFLGGILPNKTVHFMEACWKDPSGKVIHKAWLLAILC